MNAQRFLIFAYRLLLQLYPAAFRRRFAAEMLEIAEAASLAEWPLILGDTSLAIGRCWMEGTRSETLPDANAYVPIGESPVSTFGLLRGFLLSIGLVLALSYLSHYWYYRICLND